MTDLPRGIRNNNPGNIRHTQIQWQGESGIDDDGFSIFKTDVLGIRALALSLYVANVHEGFNTVYKLISHYAPPTENDTSAYIQAVCKLAGLKPLAPLDLQSRMTTAKVVKAVIAHENGKTPDSWATAPQWYSDEVVALGMDLTRRWPPATTVNEGKLANAENGTLSA